MIKLKKISKKNKLRIIVSLFSMAMVAILFGITYATLTGQLQINGTAVNRNSKWKIKFDNLQSKELSGTAEELTAPEIKDDNHIGDYSVSLASPGDYVSYAFDVINEGDYNAVIDDTFSLPSPECHGIGDNALTDCSNVLSNITYSLKYEDGTDVAVGDILESKETVTMIVKLQYNTNVDPLTLPQDDVEITNLEITIPYVQNTHAKVNPDGTTPYIKPYAVGDAITLIGEQYYIIGVGEDYLTLLKAEPLTKEEIDNNHYGEGYINKSTNEFAGTVINRNGYGGLAYYSSPTCRFSETSGCESENATNYDTSDIKHVIDDWAIDKFKNNELISIDGYKARLAQKEELRKIGWVSCSSSEAYCLIEETSPSWLYSNKYEYWTMSQHDYYYNSGNYMWTVRSNGTLNRDQAHLNCFMDSCIIPVARPVINVYKNKIS